MSEIGRAKELGNVTAAILAGGLGTRLRSFSTNKQKVLVEVKGRPFLSYLLDELSAAGVRRAVLCTGYLGEQVMAAFGDSYGDLQLTYSQEGSPLGTAGALRLALPFFRSHFVLIMNGDSFCRVNLRNLPSWHRERGANATLMLARVPDVSRYGRVRLNSKGRIISFDEKHSDGGPGWINAGIYLFKRGILEDIPAGKAVSLEREILPSLVGRGLFGFRSKGPFLDIGTPEAYSGAGRFFNRIAAMTRKNGRRVKR